MIAIFGSIHLRIGSNQISQPDQTSFGSNWSSLCFWNDPNPLRNVEAVAMCRNQKSVTTEPVNTTSILADTGSNKSRIWPEILNFYFSSNF